MRPDPAGSWLDPGDTWPGAGLTGHGRAEPGTVYLVGAGPGAADLITVRGLELLRQADVVVHDRLVGADLVARARPGAERVFVGKTSGCHTLPQEAITALLIQRARQGLAVVRLKGGDPFVFGRGGEEALALAGAGVPFEVVPGVSAALAAPAAAGIPVTHRGLASSFAVVTGHEQEGTAAVDWARVAAATDTLVLLMATGNLRRIVAGLIEHGRDASTPVAVVHGATTARQHVVLGTLADIADRAAGIPPPATVVVGAVVDLARAITRTANMEACAP